MRLKHLCKALPVLTVGFIMACSDSTGVSSDTAAPDDLIPTQQKETVSVQKIDTDDVKEEMTGPKDVSSVTRSADSHTHGDAELAIVLEGGAVTIEFESPLYNILGFEHAPRTDAQKARVTQVEKWLTSGTELFKFNLGAKCNMTSTHEAIMLFEDHRREEVSHDHHEHDDHDEASHKDLLLSYEFLCQNSAALSTVSVNLFDFFEELSEVDVTFLGPSVQRQVTLNRNNSQMDISQ